MSQAEASKMAEKGRSAFTEESIKKIESRLTWAKIVCDSSYDKFDYGPLDLYRSLEVKRPKTSTDFSSLVSSFLAGFAACGGIVILASVIVNRISSMKGRI